MPRSHPCRMKPWNPAPVLQIPFRCASIATLGRNPYALEMDHIDDPSQARSRCWRAVARPIGSRRGENCCPPPRSHAVLRDA